MKKKDIQKPSVQDHKLGHVTFEEYKELVDNSTGEITTSCRGTTKVQDKEPDFIKLYLNTMLSFQGIEGISADLLISLCGHIQGYINSETDPLVFVNNLYVKQKMAAELGVKVNMIAKYIKKLCDCGILLKSSMKGVYYVNPWLIARGKWQNIKKLQVHFDIIDGKWVVDSVLNPNTNSEENPQQEDNHKDDA